MAFFNYTAKEITLKVVYYGPGFSGKTTNLQQLHSILPSDKRGKLISLATEAYRTLFFDFLPVDFGKIRDFNIRFHLYTVPGQVRYNATRRLVLKGADAVIFVAASQREMREQNIESFKNMKENLIANNINLEEIPLILQYKKRDPPNILSIQELNKDLNENGKYKYIEAIAIDGTGAEDTFQDINKVTLDDIKHKIDQPYKKKIVREPGAEETVKGDEVVEATSGEPVITSPELEPTMYEPVIKSSAPKPSDEEHTHYKVPELQKEPKTVVTEKKPSPQKEVIVNKVELPPALLE